MSHPLPHRAAIAAACLAAISFCSTAIRAATFYVSQSGAGTQDASSSANAAPLTWFNTAANWANPKVVGKIGPGDTVYLEGTISNAVANSTTNTLTIQASGSPGSPITIAFDTNARMSSPAWPKSGAISIPGKNYITIDGGTNGVIEDTANGTSLANQVDSVGISAPECSNLIVKNLTIQNLYVRTAGTDQNAFGKCVKVFYNGGVTGFGNDLVTNCTFHDACIGFQIDYASGCTNFEYAYCTAYNCNWGGNAGDHDTTSTLNGLLVHHNRFYAFTNWDDTSASNSNHHNGFFGWAVQSSTGGSLTGARVYDNLVGPDYSTIGQTPNHATAGIFFQGNVNDIWVYNNVFVAKTGGYPSNGFIYLNPYSAITSTYRVYNNTFFGGGVGIAVNTSPNTNTLLSTTGIQTFVVNNNIDYGTATFISVFTNATAAVISDYNLEYNLVAGQEFSTSPSGSSQFRSLTDWRALGKDAHSLNVDPQFTSINSSDPTLSDYHLQVSSPAVDTGLDLSTYFTTDYAAVTRPQGVASDMGAYELPQTVAVIATNPTGHSVSVHGSTSFSVLARGAPTLAYQWQRNGTNLINDSTYSGVNTATLTITNAPIALSGSQYQCVVTNNYGGGSTATSAAATLTVNPLPVTASVTASNKVYDGGTTAVITGTALSGVDSSDVGNVSATAAAASFSSAGVGTKTVTATGLTLNGTAAANYQLTATSATTTASITPKTVTPVVTISDKVYNGSTAASIGSLGLAGVVGTDAVSLTGGSATFSDAAAGTGKSVTVTGLSLTGAAAANYTLSSSTATTTGNITPAPATIALSNTSQVFNGSAKSVTITTSPPALSVTTTYNGLPTPPINGGTYSVVVTITDPNYTGSQSGNFTITPGPQTITFATLATKTIGDPDFALTATASSTLTVTYTSSNTSVATVTGNVVHLVAPGTTTITASQGGDSNYAAATPVGVVLTVLGSTPAFTQQPTPTTKTVAPSGVASFSVVASGIPAPSFRWEMSTDGGATWNPVPNLTPYAGITTATLQIVGAQLSQDGTQFRCIANNGVGGDIVSNAATFHVDVNAPLFTTSPSNQTVTEGANVAWTVVATGNPTPSLQWQVSSDGVTWVNLTDTAPYAGTQTATLAITATPLSLNGKKYRCVATNSLDACTSFVATLTVNPLVPVTEAPVIWEDPVSRTASLGGSVLFSVSGTGSPAPTYQWRHNGVAIDGATNLSLYLTNVQVADGGTYDVILANSLGSVTSKPATLTIDSSPIITSQPTGTSVTLGGTATFTVAAQGVTPLSYQWRKNGTPIPGATGTTLTLSSVQPSDAAAYDVVVTNSLGTKTSDSALLAVKGPSYAGQYFGTLSGGGTWALNVNADNTGTFIAYLPDQSSAIVTAVTIDATGSFSANVSEIGTSSTGTSSVNGLFRPIAASVANFPLVATIAGGHVTGTISGLNQSLTGNVDIGVAADAGYYQAAALGTTPATTYSVVGASGKALVVTTTPSVVDALSGTVDSNGALTGTTAQGAHLTVTLNPQAETLAATYSSSSTPNLQFSGLSSTVASTTHIVNLSARASAGTASGTLIVGFTVTGTGQKSLLVRGVGPVLAPYGVTNPLTDPVLSLYAGQTLLTGNDNWSSDVNAGQAATVANSLNAFPLTSGSLDAALLTSRDPGVYTAVVSANGTANGVALAEIYDAAASGARLSNVSARGQVGTGGNVMIVGFVVAGNAPRQYLVRAIGPSLTQFNVGGVLANPQLSVVQQGTSTVLAQNDDWAGTAALQSAFTSVNAFTLDPASKDAAALVTLAPGNYSLVVSGVNNTTGVGLVEVYELP